MDAIANALPFAVHLVLLGVFWLSALGLVFTFLRLKAAKADYAALGELAEVAKAAAGGEAPGAGEGPGEEAAGAAPDPSLVTQYHAGTGEGIEELEKQLEEDPDNPDILDWLAFTYYTNQMLEKAVETYQRAIAIDYDNSDRHFYLANAYYKLGQVDRALEEWEIVISLKPDSKQAKKAEERIEKAKAGGSIDD